MTPPVSPPPASSPAPAPEHPVDWHTPFCWGQPVGGPGLTVRHFRLSFDLSEVPAALIAEITADSRFRFFVNGQLAARGPFKGTLQHYHVESCDLAPFLQVGRNVLAAEVRWFGENAPQSEVHSAQPGWLLHCADLPALNTPGQWRTRPDDAVTPDTTDSIDNAQQFLNHTERVDLRRRDGLDWLAADYDDAAWDVAVQIGAAPNHASAWGLSDLHTLFPNPLPPLAETPARFARAWRDHQPVSLPFGDPPRGWTIDRGVFASLLLETDALTTGFISVDVDGGRDREVHITYGEALGTWTEREGQRVWVKAGRRDNPTKDLHGYRDTVILSGRRETYEPFHWRTFRFVRIDVLAGAEPCTIEDVRYRECVFPQVRQACFTSSDPDVAALWETSWRTARLCAHETYEDCPYYEQLHYIADTRLQARLSLYLCNDTRLARHGLRLYRDSLRPDGLIGSRVPSVSPQIIPYFCFHWISMLEDYWQWVGPADADFIRSCLPAVDQILVFFRNRLRPDGFVGHVPRWNMVDERPDWLRGEPNAVIGGASTWLTASFVQAIEAAIRLHDSVGLSLDADRWRALPTRLREAIASMWAEDQGVFLEGPQHRDETPVLLTQCAVLAAGAPTPSQRDHLTRYLATADLQPVTLMQSHYLARTLEALGLYGRFHTDVLNHWRTMLAAGTTTWWEYPDPTRSDCHAWSAWIATDFLSTVLGIRPGAPGWTRIVIAPQIDGLDYASGAIESPVGTVEVSWQKTKSRWQCDIRTPVRVPVDLLLPNGSREVLPQGGERTVEMALPLDHARG